MVYLDQNGVSQAWYIVEICHSGRKPLILGACVPCHKVTGNFHCILIFLLSNQNLNIFLPFVMLGCKIVDAHKLLHGTQRQRMVIRHFITPPPPTTTTTTTTPSPFSLHQEHTTYEHLDWLLNGLRVHKSLYKFNEMYMGTLTVPWEKFSVVMLVIQIFFYRRYFVKWTEWLSLIVEYKFLYFFVSKFNDYPGLEVCVRIQWFFQLSMTSGVPDQNGVSQAWYIVEMYRSGRKPSIWTRSLTSSLPATSEVLSSWWLSGFLLERILWTKQHLSCTGILCNWHMRTQTLIACYKPTCFYTRVFQNSVSNRGIMFRCLHAVFYEGDIVTLEKIKPQVHKHKKYYPKKKKKKKKSQWCFWEVNSARNFYVHSFKLSAQVQHLMYKSEKEFRADCVLKQHQVTLYQLSMFLFTLILFYSFYLFNDLPWSILHCTLYITAQLTTEACMCVCHCVYVNVCVSDRRVHLCVWEHMCVCVHGC